MSNSLGRERISKLPGHITLLVGLWGIKKGKTEKKTKIFGKKQEERKTN